MTALRAEPLTDALVLGAGVIGLTTAIHMAERDRTVRVIADRPSGATTSANAGAIWEPMIDGEERLKMWSEHAFDILEKLATEEDTGVRMVSGRKASRSPQVRTLWERQPDFEAWEPTGDGSEYVDVWACRAPVIDMPRYLEYLEERLARTGTKVETTDEVPALEQLSESARVIVNCTGHRARHLGPGDDEVEPVKGQLVVVENPGLDTFFCEQLDDRVADSAYFFPHGDVMLLGGSARLGDDTLDPDPEVARAIQERCGEIEPRLRDAKVLGHRVGIRPQRSAVRLELDRLGDTGHVVHNYGHGWAGVTLAWGAAAEAHALSTQVLG